MDDAKNFMLSMMQTLKERFGNPFIGGFVAAWCTWNFRILLVIFGTGEDGWEGKVNYIFNTHMPHWYDWLLHGYIIPAVAALFWIYVMPRALQPIAKHHEKNLNKTREILYEASGQKVLTVQEAADLRTHILDERSKILDDKEKISRTLQLHITEVTELKTKNSTQAEELIKIMSEKTALEKQSAIISGKNDIFSALINPNPINIDSNNLSPSRIEEIRTAIGFIEKSSLGNNETISALKTDEDLKFPIICKQEVYFDGDLAIPKDAILDRGVITACLVLSRSAAYEAHTISRQQANSDIRNRHTIGTERVIEYLEFNNYLKAKNSETFVINRSLYISALLFDKIGFSRELLEEKILLNTKIRSSNSKN